MTIPEIFRTKWKQILTGKSNDVVAIRTAMEYGRSGTHEGFRGKGSRDALSVLEKHGTGTLYVISNTGWISYDYAKGVEVNFKSGNLGIDIGGTIIWWTLPLKDE